MLGLSAPDIITGEFEDGFIFGVAKLTWSDLDYFMDTYVSYGAVHGMFKIHDKPQDRWMIGTRLCAIFQNLAYT